MRGNGLAEELLCSRLMPQKTQAQPAPELLPVIASNVARLRGARHLSLETLAARAQLDALTLRRIEKASELPSLDTLWSLANALGTTFSALIQREASAEARLSRRSLLPRASGTQLHEMTLAPHSEGLTPAGEPHTMESLLVTAGELVVHYQNEHRVLSVGEELDVPAYVERRYQNPTDQTTVVYAKLGPSVSLV